MVPTFMCDNRRGVNSAAVRLRRWVLALLTPIAMACGGDDGASVRTAFPPPPSSGSVVATRVPADDQEAPGAGFRSRSHLREHFEKHGRGLGVAEMATYAARARALRDTTVGGAVLELRRADGVISRFDRGSGAFIAFDADGTIRTFFRPNDGEGYFRRQARRRASP
jgi:hypothetical protein